MARSTSQGLSAAAVEDRSDPIDARQLDARRLEDLRAECDALRRQLDAARDGALFAEALEAVSEAIVLYDADGRLVTCNRNFRELYGYSEEEARPGVHFAELGRLDMARGHVVIGDEVGGGEAYLARKAEYRRKLEGSFIVQLKDGRWLKTTDRRMSGGGFVSVQVDVTELKRNEQVCRRAMEEAEAAARSKSEFLANISHDLRTPLNAILGFSEMILGEVAGPFDNDSYTGTYRGYLENIHKGGRLLLSIVNDILDTAKLDSGKYNLRPERFDPLELTGEVLATFTPAAREKDLSLSVAAPPEGLPSVVTDRRALIQIMNNLVSNACKHTEPGGAVELRWRVTEGGALEFAVVDNGVGMPAELIAKIGEPFLADGSATALRGERGTGLGFYICTKLVALLGATLAVDSTPGEGTTVTVRWPLPTLAPEPRA